jgi:hypothetical protein
MLLFRDEDEISHWAKQTGEARGEYLTLEKVWELSKLWYANRMSPDYRGRSVQDAEAIFGQLGLNADFWKFKT